jgi:NarL family two-component system response regulator LiaR
LAAFERAAPALRVERAPLDADVDAGDADAVVVDMGDDEHAALEVVQTLIAARPGVPVAALLCCPHCVVPETLRSLLAAGVSGILDLHMSPVEAERLVTALVDGDTVLHLQLGGGRRGVLQDLAVRSPLRDVQAQVLSLVARGLHDREIGERLHLSPHTVKHRVEQLRRTVRARNRTELAAWAGRNGFFRLDDE